MRAAARQLVRRVIQAPSSTQAVRSGRAKTRSALWVLQREQLLLPDDHVPEEEGVSGVLHEEMFHTCAARQSPGWGCLVADRLPTGVLMGSAVLAILETQ